MVTKQEIIREGIAKGICVDGGNIWNSAPENLRESYRKSADAIITFLHSQGVVIKVDRKLPDIPFKGETRRILIQLGCGFFEPLIEEGLND